MYVTSSLDQVQGFRTFELHPNEYGNNKWALFWLETTSENCLAWNLNVEAKAYGQ